MDLKAINESFNKPEILESIEDITKKAEQELLFLNENLLSNIGARVEDIKKIIRSTFRFMSSGNVFVYVGARSISSSVYSKLIDLKNELQTYLDKMGVSEGGMDYIKTFIGLVLAIIRFAIVFTGTVLKKSKNEITEEFDAWVGIVLVSTVLSGISLPIISLLYFMIIVFWNTLEESVKIPFFTAIFGFDYLEAYSAGFGDEFLNKKSTTTESFNSAISKAKSIFSKDGSSVGVSNEEADKRALDDILNMVKKTMRSNPRKVIEVLFNMVSTDKDAAIAAFNNANKEIVRGGVGSVVKKYIIGISSFVLR